MEGRVWRYQVGWIEVLEPESVEEMVVPKAKADWDLTLFTCTIGGQTRRVVRCIRIEGE